MVKAEKHHEIKKCKTCGGRGIMKWDCPDCWGTGYAPDVETLSKCKNGTNRCPTCCGKGKIPSKCLICGGSGLE